MCDASLMFLLQYPIEPDGRIVFSIKFMQKSSGMLQWDAVWLSVHYVCVCWCGYG